MSLTIDLYDAIAPYKVHFRGCALIPSGGKRNLEMTNQVAARLFDKVCWKHSCLALNTQHNNALGVWAWLFLRQEDLLVFNLLLASGV